MCLVRQFRACQSEYPTSNRRTLPLPPKSSSPIAEIGDVLCNKFLAKVSAQIREVNDLKDLSTVAYHVEDVGTLGLVASG